MQIPPSTRSLVEVVSELSQPDVITFGLRDDAQHLIAALRVHFSSTVVNSRRGRTPRSWEGWSLPRTCRGEAVRCSRSCQVEHPLDRPRCQTPSLPDTLTVSSSTAAKFATAHGVAVPGACVTAGGRDTTLAGAPNP